MRSKAIHTLIDDVASKSKHMADAAVDKTVEVLARAGNAGKEAATTIAETFSKGGHRAEETVNSASHDAAEVAVKAVHAAEEVVQAVNHGAREMAAKVQHRGRELAERAARKLKPR